LSRASQPAKPLQALVANAKLLSPAERINRAIFVLRGHRVLLDAELATLYGVTTKVFNQAVKRNFKRFPEDFLFQLNTDEVNTLRSQIVTLKRGRGQHPKYLPYAFTEHGAIMVATILNSPRAIEMSIYVVRAFVQTRESLDSEAARHRFHRRYRAQSLKPDGIKAFGVLGGFKASLLPALR
jgi:hypothetical protein